MKKFTFALAAGCALCLGIGVTFAQDDQDRVEIASKIVPAEIYACQYNEGQGPSELDAAVNSWNGYMDENDTDNYAAWTLTKVHYGPEQEFDFLWLGAWTDGNAMGAGTDEIYATGVAYLENFARVATCGAHVNSASINYKLPEGGTPANSILTFSNCNIPEGQSYAPVARATSEWANILADAGSQAAIYHWFPVYGGGGESPDFQSVIAYPNHAELGADYERMTNGEMFRRSAALYDGIVDCDVRRSYNATMRRAAKLR